MITEAMIATSSDIDMSRTGDLCLIRMSQRIPTMAMTIGVVRIECVRMAATSGRAPVVVSFTADTHLLRVLLPTIMYNLQTQ